MSQVSFLMGAETTGAPAGDDLVVLVATTPEERVRLIRRIGGTGPVLVVSSAEEAHRILHPRPATSVALHAPGIRILGDRQSLVVGGREIQLTQLEFALFNCLISPIGQVWAFGELSQQVWGTSHVGDGSQVHAVVKRLRRKLNELSAPVAIEAVRGVGFRAVGRRQIHLVRPVPKG